MPPALLHAYTHARTLLSAGSLHLPWTKEQESASRLTASAGKLGLWCPCSKLSSSPPAREGTPASPASLSTLIPSLPCKAGETCPLCLVGETEAQREKTKGPRGILGGVGGAGMWVPRPPSPARLPYGIVCPFAGPQWGASLAVLSEAGRLRPQLGWLHFGGSVAAQSSHPNTRFSDEVTW